MKGVGHAKAAILDFNLLSFSYFVFLRSAPMLLNKFEPKWIIVFRRDFQNINSQHFSHINV